MKSLEKKEKRVRMILDKLGEAGLSASLRDLISGWLLSSDSEDEKDRQLAERFDDEFARTGNPSREAQENYRVFARKYGLAKAAPMRVLNGRRMLRVAAVLIPIMLLAGSFFWWNSQDAKIQNLTAVVVDAGSTAQKVALTDNSIVHVMPGSEIEYGDRYVKLNGEAHFNVTKATNADDKFTVRTDLMEITVLGTEFRVDCSAKKDYSTIKLLHGSVAVDLNNQKVMLHPGENLRYDHNTSEISVSHIALNEREYQEMPGLVFDNVSLSDVCNTIENSLGVHFVIDNDVLVQQELIRGDFTNMHSLDQLMTVLQKLSGQFDYEMTDEEIRIKTHNG